MSFSEYNHFYENKGQLSATLLDFWKWNQSNLLENRTRGILAEYIVKLAVGDFSPKRIEWDNYDLISLSGKKIEVKSAAYIQAWYSGKFSKISFNIAPGVGAKDHSDYDGFSRQWADYYIFCLLHHKDETTIDPLNVNQWTFFVLSTQKLDKERPTEKTITLSSLKSLNPIICDFNELRNLMQG